MRHQYREYKSSGEKNGILDENKVKLLEDLGFACKKKPGLLWMAQYNLLKSFKEEHGHCHVPMHWKDDRKLGHWVNNQRQLYRKYKSGLPTSMNESRIELLEEIGFAWVLGKDWKEKRKEDTQKRTQDTPNIESGGGDMNDKMVDVQQSPAVIDDDELETPETESHGPENDEVAMHVEDLDEDLGNNDNDAESLDGNTKKETPEDPRDDGGGNSPKPSSNTSSTKNSDHDLVEDVNSLDYMENVSPKPTPEAKKVPRDEKLDMEQSSRNSPSVESSNRRAFKRKFCPTVPEVEVDGKIFSHILFSERPSQFDADDSGSDSDDSGKISRKIRRTTKRARTPYNTSKHWNKRFDDLVQFKEVHGDCNVPFQVRICILI